MKFRYFIKLWTDSALEARAALWHLSTSAREDGALALPGAFSTVVGESLTWSGKVSLLHCQLHLQFAASRLCLCTVVEFHLCVAPCFFHCRYKKWLLPHGSVNNISHVEPMLRVSQKRLSNSRGTGMFWTGVDTGHSQQLKAPNSVGSNRWT